MDISSQKNLQKPIEKVKLGDDTYVELLPLSSNNIRLNLIAEKANYVVELLQRAKEEENILIPFAETFGPITATAAQNISNEFRSNMMIFERKRIITTSNSKDSFKKAPSKVAPEITGSSVIPTIRKTILEILEEIGGMKTEPKGTFVINQLTEKTSEVEILKGQVARRNKLLAEQRTAYLKELVHLKELLYRKNRGEKVEESWGQFFDYGETDLKRSSSISLTEDQSDIRNLQASSSQAKAVATLSQLKRDIGSEKRKLRVHFETELKKQETTHKQTLKAKDREISELKTQLEKKTGEIEEGNAKVEEIKKKLNEIEDQKVLESDPLDDEHQKTIASLISDEQDTIDEHKEILEEEFKSKLAELSKEYQKTMNDQTTKIQEQAIIIEELKIQIIAINKSSRNSTDQNTKTVNVEKVEIERMLEQKTIEFTELQKVVENQKDEIQTLRKQGEELFNRMIKSDQLKVSNQVSLAKALSQEFSNSQPEITPSNSQNQSQTPQQLQNSRSINETSIKEQKVESVVNNSLDLNHSTSQNEKPNILSSDQIEIVPTKNVSESKIPSKQNSALFQTNNRDTIDLQQFSFPIIEDTPSIEKNSIIEISNSAVPLNETESNRNVQEEKRKPMASADQSKKSRIFSQSPLNLVSVGSETSFTSEQDTQLPEKEIYFDAESARNLNKETIIFVNSQPVVETDEDSTQTDDIPQTQVSLQSTQTEPKNLKDNGCQTETVIIQPSHSKSSNIVQEEKPITDVGKKLSSSSKTTLTKAFTENTSSNSQPIRVHQITEVSNETKKIQVPILAPTIQQIQLQPTQRQSTEFTVSPVEKEIEVNLTDTNSSNDSDVWDRLLNKAQKSQSKARSLEGERQEQLERVLGENLKLSPRYSKEVLNRYHQPTQPSQTKQEVIVKVEKPSTNATIEFVRTSVTPTITKTRTMPVALEKSGSHSVTLSFLDECSTPNLFIPKIRKSENKITSVKEIKTSSSSLSGFLSTQSIDSSTLKLTKTPSSVRTLSVQKSKS